MSAHVRAKALTPERPRRAGCLTRLLPPIGLGIVLAASAAAALALGGQNMVLGRMSQARPDAPSAATTTHARAHYVLHCAGCHGLNAAGSPGAGVPDMRRMGDFLRVPGGREFIIKVPGVMASGLNDEQIADVTNWLLRTWARDSWLG